MSERQVTEVHIYEKEQLAEMAKQFAKMAIVGSFFTGRFIHQQVKWEFNSIIISTTYVRDELVKQTLPRKDL